MNTYTYELKMERDVRIVMSFLTRYTVKLILILCNAAQTCQDTFEDWYIKNEDNIMLVLSTKINFALFSELAKWARGQVSDEFTSFLCMYATVMIFFCLFTCPLALHYHYFIFATIMLTKMMVVTGVALFLIFTD